MQAFKIIVADPDSVLNALTREVIEIGPDRWRVDFVCVRWLLDILSVHILSWFLSSFTGD